MSRRSRRSPRVALTACIAAVALAASALLGTSAAVAETAPPVAETTDAATPVATMGEYSLDDYAELAAQMPSELVSAISDGLDDSPADYLARADAAADAVIVVDDLRAQGVDVLSSRLEGTDLVVNVADQADVAAVAAVNATPEIGERTPDAAQLDAIRAAASGAFEFKGDLVGGQGYYSEDDYYYYYCSTAFNGQTKSGPPSQTLTAGHCLVPGTIGGGYATEMVQSYPDDDEWRVGSPIGWPDPGSYVLGNGLDTGLITTSGMNPLPQVGTWNNNTGPVTAGARQTIRDYADTIVGQPVCKSGRTSGWTCGTILETDVTLTARNDAGVAAQINVDLTDLCALAGDSGGAAVSSSFAVGLLSAGTYDNNCAEKDRYSALFPMVAVPGRGSVTSSELNWEPIVEVAAPIVDTPAGGELRWGLPITGSVPGGSIHHSVRITIDSGRTYTAPVAADGTWSLIISDLSNSTHSYYATTAFGSGIGQNGSLATNGWIRVVGAPSVARIAGTDRYDGAVKISQAAYPAPATVPVVYVATGQNYPDALSAGPAAVKQGGPLLLVTRDEVPAVVQAEIRRLAPGRIVVVGGPNSVSDAVAGQLGTLVAGTSVERLAGADRYAASRAVVQSVFGSPEGATAPSAYAATGTNFPDALSAGGAAGSALEPVVLVNGSQPSADAETLQLFRSLQTQSIVVAGGPNSVSQGVLDSLSGVPASVSRVSAADRYQTSIALNQAFTSSSTVYLATGLNFPDALAGGVLAGTTHAPLYVVPTDCVPRGVLSDIQRLGATKVVLLGGPNSLSQNVQNLAACPA
ncbi:cell wall-binding repeat-containing protein [Herbiconiux solani]|uniref:cell wall-binding repeat-containing protein n=1 Tax=Herbiconiux solani TaxID=661329 RepID=UPI000826D216|nr:cell wall-binding repeat-containing protein [Herbiconiux solani]